MEQFLAEVRAYAAANGVSPEKVLREALNSEWSRWGRWADGKASPQVKTIERVRAYMADNPPSLKVRGDAA